MTETAVSYGPPFITVPSLCHVAGALNDSLVGIIGAQYQGGLSLGELLILIWEVWTYKSEDELLGIESMGEGM